MRFRHSKNDIIYVRTRQYFRSGKFVKELFVLRKIFKRKNVNKQSEVDRFA